MDIKDTNVSMINCSYIKNNTMAYLHKCTIHINQVFKVYYLQYIVNLCYIIMPSAYEQVSRECK